MNIDTNINNYTLQELYDIVGTENKDEIDDKINALLNQVVISAAPNKNNLIQFLSEIKTKLLAEEFDEDEIEDAENKLTTPNSERLILLDSSFRDYESTSETNFTIELKYPVSNVISLRLYSYSIPYSSYNIDAEYGNNRFSVYDDANDMQQIEFPSGRYSNDQFLTQLNSLMTSSVTWSCSFSLNTSSGKLTFTSDQNMSFFFDSNTITGQPMNSLGWIMGFRSQMTSVISGVSCVAQCVLNLIGPKYLVLDIDDYNNTTTSLLSTSSNTTEHISLPSYYVSGQPRITFPRSLTQAQIYTIQEILKTNKTNQETASTVLEPLSSASNIFAIIPFKHNETFSSINVEFGGTVQENKRCYVGPVTIKKLRIKLFDDKNNILNLNGLEWSFMLIAELK